MRDRYCTSLAYLLAVRFDEEMDFLDGWDTIKIDTLADASTV